jgi:hypothetical protein
MTEAKMKMSIFEWAELAAMAQVYALTKKPSVLLKFHRDGEGEVAALTRRGLIRWPSANRAVVTKKGIAALKTKSTRFLARACVLAEKRYQREHPGW